MESKRPHGTTGSKIFMRNDLFGERSVDGSSFTRRSLRRFWSMGENVLQGQMKSFKKGADRALQAMSAPTLFSRPDIISTTYTAAPLDGCAISEGDHVHAHASA